MPIYVYRDERTGTEVEILRSIGNSDEVPTESEALAVGLIPSDYQLASWTKVPQGGVSVRKPWGWGQKGSW